MKCGKKGAQKLIKEFTGSCRGEKNISAWLIENKFCRGRFEIIWGISLKWFRSFGIGMMGEWVKKIIIMNWVWTYTRLKKLNVEEYDELVGYTKIV